MKKKDDQSSCSGLIIGVVVFFLLCKLVEYLETIEILRTIVGYFFLIAFVALLTLYLYVGIVGLWGHFSARKNHNYPVRCWLIEQSTLADSNSEKSPLAHQEGAPVYLLLTINDFELKLTALQASCQLISLPADNASRFSLMIRGQSTPIQLARRSTSLYYRLMHYEDLTVTEVNSIPPAYFPGREQKETMHLDLANLKIHNTYQMRNHYERRPHNEIGFTGQLSGEPEDPHIRIILVNQVSDILELVDSSMNEEQQIKLKLEVVKQDGVVDQHGTRELYQRLLIFKNNPSQYDAEDDDSWMYRSRPFYW